MDNPRFEGWSRYRWENQVTRRYYEARMQENLFGCWEVFVIWGGIGTRLGNAKVIPVDSKTAAQVIIDKIAKRRARHDYTLD